MSTVTDPGGGWVARSFTRARVLGTYLARIPLGDKSFDLPVVLNRAQLLVGAVGAIAAVAAYVIGSALGAAAAMTWPVAVATVATMVGVGFAPVPERGVTLYVGGYARMLVSALPLAAARESSIRTPRHSSDDASMQVTIHPAPQRSR
ncbi:hypothetical protein MAHJHV58_00120 [Mycobacterium avium subsp. hominissuis]|uniref:hypothetical protein n=1 Tax=Mycobacterium avium TaxID=1764 RepID=UPI0004465121|nr:hypothetical protein [Mycobacterium avium]ETZ55302.1 hypothetical protein L838_0958 [Mycobacterium avium MAV_120709_2344]MCA4736657.1 hypothetical protein [Mycobacterium avium subsp. hominissuis]MCA4741250.1 hypothetical protein [Mycobacterium avium subsp. hominissuis]MCA4745945.1 hypothetical protein [Mycobacterium avium subsp. hominissuis]MCA4766123.1 hypothetical protein [Mycobacterium avium subsp. hominissuis]